MNDSGPEQSQPDPVRELTSSQQRVLGVLLEKAYTTPEYYPLTLKAVMSGCNQKSNRSPVVNYDEDRVEEVLGELKELGLVGELHPDSGRALRYRHYMRKRYSFTEPQLAVLTELLLRGRQTLGELRSRASRMVPISDLATLREELQGLIEQGFVQASGRIDRRGVEVDHGFYRASDMQAFPQLPDDGAETAARSASAAHTETALAPTVAGERVSATDVRRGEARVADQTPDVEALQAAVAELRQQNTALNGELTALQNQVEQLTRDVEDLRRDLGV